jgi:PAS domain S-box-containing protein
MSDRLDSSSFAGEELSHVNFRFHQQIFDSSDDCIKVLDLEGRLLFMNRGGQALLGIEDITPFLKQSWTKFWLGADRQAAARAISLAKAGQVFTFQGYCQTLVSKPKWWDSKVSPIRGADGQVESLLCVCRDITKRRHSDNEHQLSQELCRESEERFSAIFSQAKVGLGEISLDGHFQRVNDELCRILGRSREEVLAASILDVTHPEDIAQTLEAFTTLIQTKEAVSLDKRYLRLDGTTVWANSRLSCLDDEQGNGRSVLAVTVDLSERKRIEATLDEQRRLYEAVLTTTPDLAYVFDLNHRFIYANEGLLKMWGKTWDEAIGRNCLELGYEPWHALMHDQEIEKVIATGQPIRGEVPFTGSFGRRIYDYIFTPVFDQQSQVVAIAGTTRDITEGKRREANAAFLADIADDFSRLSSADEIMQTVGAKIGAYLKITTCNFNDVDESQREVTVHYGWNSTEVPSTMGTFRIKDYLSEEFEQASRCGETFVIRDTQTDLRTNADGYAALKMHSFVTVPFHRNGRWTHYIAICDSRPREWRDDEIALIEEISNRIFPRLERARTEAALRVSEAKYRSLFESIDEGFCILQLIFDEQDKPIDYRYIEINPAFLKQTGMKNALGKTIRQLVPNIEGFWFDIYGKVALTGEPKRFTDHAESMGRWFDVYAFRIGEPHERKVAVLFKDISEYKCAEAAIAADLRDTQLLRDLSVRFTSECDIGLIYNEILADAIALMQADAGSFQSFNNATQQMLLLTTQGFSPTVAKYFESVDASFQTSCSIALATRQRAFINFDELENDGPCGSRRIHLEAGYVCSQSTPLISRSGKLVGMVSTHWRTHYQPSDRELRFLDLLARQAADLIEQRQNEALRQQLLEQEKAAREEAERVNRIKDEFLAVLSHELRSPLNPILGWSNLLQKNKLNPAKTAQALSTIQRNAKLQLELIEDLLDVSRILSGKLSLNVAPLNLVSTIQGAMETMQLAAQAKLIDVEVSFEVDECLVLGDATRLQQVIWNLLSNAVKFTDSGGQVNITLEQQSAHAQITICDTGQGIDPDFLPYVFDYFRQANAATTRKFGGLGLGLAIVRHLVELHGGTVEVQSLGEGMGATFTVRLPLIPTQTTITQNAQSSELVSDLTGIRVLVVDDESDSREFIAFVLEQAGAKVMTANNAHEAMTTLIHSQPDILLSDIGMPEVDGYMLMQQVRALPKEQGGQVKAIALTAYAGDFNQQQALQAGFQQHIPKPVEVEMLVKAIISLLKS